MDASNLGGQAYLPWCCPEIALFIAHSVAHLPPPYRGAGGQERKELKTQTSPSSEVAVRNPELCADETTFVNKLKPDKNGLFKRNLGKHVALYGWHRETLPGYGNPLTQASENAIPQEDPKKHGQVGEGW